MKIVELQQGSNLWHEHRAKHFNASDAPAMMGASKYKTRTQLLQEYATGIRPEVDSATQYLFDKGHAAEAAARPIAEGIIGEDLYPVTGTSEVYGLPLSASFDGLVMDESIGWEHKMLNKDLRLMHENGLDMQYKWQLAHQMAVSGADKVLFMASDAEEHYEVWMHRDEGLIDTLIAGWKQFAEDLACYQHVEVAVEAVGRAPDALPALHIEVTGMVTASNLADFHAAALSTFASINRDLQTDQDFANAQKAIKFCSDVESKVEQAKSQALSQTQTIEELFRVMDSVKAEARVVRLELEKLDAKRKIDIRAEIQREGQIALQAHVDTINARLAPIRLPALSVDFAGVMKGKKTVVSLRDAVDSELARAKIEASQLSELIGVNMVAFDVLAINHKTLFSDLQLLIVKPLDDFSAIVKSRIADHDAEVAKKAAAAPVAAAPVAEPSARTIQVTIDGKPATHEEVAAAVGLPSSKRPTDNQIIFAVATQFNVDFHTAAGWIKEIDFSEMRNVA